MRISSLPAYLAAFMLCTASVQASTIVGLTTNNELVTFNAAIPGSASPAVAVSGLISGHTLSGIDYRPIDGALVGVSTNTAGQAQAYVINPLTGMATTLGNLFSVLPGSTLGIDFNPVPNALRIVSDAEANLRITMGGGGVVNTDSSLTRTSGSPDPDLRVVSAAYSNNVPGGNAGATTLYVIDALTGALYNQGILNFAAPTPGLQGPNGGLLTLIGSLGLGTNLGNNIGFDINNVGSAYASSGNAFFSINLSTGATTQLGTIGGNSAIRDIAAAPVPEPSTILVSALGLAGLGYLRRKR
jgi:hypothetical protein